MNLFYYLTLFLVGLSVGSFFNVLTFRYNPLKNLFYHNNLKGRSKCEFCDKHLRWFELIPIFSFLIQLGRCRRCGHRLSLQYPVVETLSGLIFVSLPFYFQRFYGILEPFSFSPDLRSYYGFLVLWILIFLIWLLISIIDYHHYVIPNGLNLSLVVIGIVIVAIKTLSPSWLFNFHSSFLRNYELFFGTQVVWLNHLLGAFVGGLFFLLFIIASRGRAIGMGDVKLAFASGLILGWPDIGLTIILAFILGGFLGAALLISGRKTMRDKVPFAPIFILGAVVTVFFGFEVVDLYFGLFNI